MYIPTLYICMCVCMHVSFYMHFKYCGNQWLDVINCNAFVMVLYISTYLHMFTNIHIHCLCVAAVLLHRVVAAASPIEVAAKLNC